MCVCVCVCFGLGVLFVEVPRHQCTGVCSIMVGVECHGTVQLMFDAFRGGCGTLYEKARRRTFFVAKVS